MQGTLVGLCVVVAAVVAPVGAATGVASAADTSGSLNATANSAPLADAGLDQTVRAGQSVRLDATGSRDPDGSIARYDWTITAPNETTFEPACGTCGRTRFVPAREGQYNVTVTVTDNDGASRSDTLYVDANGTVLSVSMTGPTEPQVGVERTYTVELVEDRSVETVRWRTNRSLRREVTVGGEIGEHSEAIEFTDDRPRRLTVLVRTSDGQLDAAEMVVRPQASRAPRSVSSDDGGCGVACGVYHGRNGNQFDGTDGTTGYEDEAEAVESATSGPPFFDPDISGGDTDRAGQDYPW